MRELKERAVWCCFSSPQNAFISAKDGAVLQRGPTAVMAAVAGGDEDPDPNNLPAVAQASIAAMERAKAAEAKVADPGTLVTFAEAMAAVHRLVGDSYPPHFALALSLDAAGVIAASLLGAWDDARDSIKEGADLWTATLDSYTEKCWTGADGTTALRIIARGKLPSPCRPPRRVEVQDRGMVTLTCQRINPRPAWQGDSSGIIRDCTEALTYLLTPKQPQYIQR